MILRLCLCAEGDVLSAMLVLSLKMAALDSLQMPPERLLSAHLPDHSIALHFVDCAGGHADMDCHVLRLTWPVDARDRLFGELGRPAGRQPRHARPAVLQIEPVSG